MDRILSAYEFVVEVASRQVLKLNPGKKVSHLVSTTCKLTELLRDHLCLRSTRQ